MTREIVLSLFAAIFSGAAIHAALTHAGGLAAFKTIVDLLGGKTAENMTQIPYALVAGGISLVAYLVAGALFL